MSSAQPRVGIFTGCRSDFGLVLPVIEALRKRPVRMMVYASGNHFSRRFGFTVRLVARACRVLRSWKAFSDDLTPRGIARGLGRLAQMAAREFDRMPPDLVILTGDRLELLPVAQTAAVFRIPLAHIGGGETTLGAVDQRIRTCLTALAERHFVGHPEFARRVIASGVEESRVIIAGETAVDTILSTAPAEPSQLEKQFGFLPDRQTILVTFHPETLAPDYGIETGRRMLAGLRRCENPVICTYPNADPGSEAVIKLLQEEATRRPGFHLHPNLGGPVWIALLNSVGALVGNSSSGIIEAPSFGLPVVNVGERQAGRLRGANVVDATDSVTGFVTALTQALSPEFRCRLTSRENPYGDGHAGERIAENIAAWVSQLPPHRRILRERPKATKRRAKTR
jgi:UDP-hydrolysing UDP-N-acetyl-D-glucosamine 2-epimerase